MLRARVSRLTEASSASAKNLDLDVVLQEIVDSARSLTDARYSAITTLDESGELQDVLFSGLNPEDRRQILALPEWVGAVQVPDGFRGAVEDGRPCRSHQVGRLSEGYLPARTFLGNAGP